VHVSEGEGDEGERRSRRTLRSKLVVLGVELGRRRHRVDLVGRRRDDGTLVQSLGRDIVDSALVVACERRRDEEGREGQHRRPFQVRVDVGEGQDVQRSRSPSWSWWRAWPLSWSWSRSVYAEGEGERE